MQVRNNAASFRVIRTGQDGSSVSIHFSGLSGEKNSSEVVFNCGEGLQRVLSDQRISASKVNTILLLDLSIESIGGIPGFSISRREKKAGPTYVYGPVGTSALLKSYTSIIPGELNLSIVECINSSNVSGNQNVATCLTQDADGPMLIKGDGTTRIEAFTIGKRNGNIYQTIMYRVQGVHHRGKFLPELAEKLGVAKGPDFSKLNRGETVTTSTGRVVTPEEVHMPSDPVASAIIFSCPNMEVFQEIKHHEAFQKTEEVLKPNADNDESSNQTASASNRFATESKNKKQKKPQVFLVETKLFLRSVIHITPIEVASTKEYREWIESFPEYVSHTFVHTSICKPQVPFLRSTKLINQLKTIDPIIFREVSPLFGLETTQNTNSSISFSQKASVAELGTLIKISPYAAVGSELLSLEIENPIAGNETVLPTSYISLLGTGSTEPSAYRGVTSSLLRFDDQSTMLVDIGEGSYLQMRRLLGIEQANKSVSDLKCIWISHKHADHCLGVVHLLLIFIRQRIAQCASGSLSSSFSLPLVIILPKTLLVWLQNMIDLGMLFINFPLDQNDFVIQQFILVDCNSTTSNNPEDPNISKLKSILNLSSITSVPVKHCHEAYGLILERSNGENPNAWKKLVFSGDTAMCPRLIKEGMDATLLVHEATFEDDKVERARKTRHSTFGDAFQTSKDMNTEYLLLSHFSARNYNLHAQFENLEKSSSIQNYAKENFVVGTDLMTLDLEKLNEIPTLMQMMRDKLSTSSAGLTGDDEEGDDEEKGYGDDKEIDVSDDE